MKLFSAFPILNVGVIGGADGPTAIFVTTSPSFWFWIGLIAMAAIAAVILFFLRRKNK